MSEQEMSAPDTSPETPVARLTTRAVLGIGVWSAFVAIAAAYVAFSAGQQSMQAELALRPKIVVVDTFGWIKNAGRGASTEERYLDGSRRLKVTSEELAKKGVLVLDVSGVRGYPADLRLKTPHAQEDDQ